ncbi:MAG: superoxide dismutase family protein, partial [Solirubrobacteraceae bacterium]
MGGIMRSGIGRVTGRRGLALCGVAAAAVLGVAVSAAAGGGERHSDHARGVAVAELRDAGGAAIGTATFLARPGGSLRVRVHVRGLAPGFHGFHVHGVGQCVAPFSTAGGHLQAAGQAHGAHAGDMPPLLVLRDGTASARFETDAIGLAQLLDRGGDGSALIVHAERDNLANIPARYPPPADATGTTGPDATTLATGDSGARAACGT